MSSDRDSKGRFMKGHLKSNTGRTLFKKGISSWNKGTKGVMKPNKTSFKKGECRYPETCFKKGGIGFNKNHTLESRQKMSITHKKLHGEGKEVSWNKGLKLPEEMKAKMRGPKHTLESKRKIALIWQGKKFSEQHKEKIRVKTKNSWGKIDYRKKVLGRREMSSLEVKMDTIIKKYNLPYVFVGNGEFSIGRKVPDFINTNGKKIAVETFCVNHKELFRNGGVDGWKKSRSELFLKYGWQIEFFDATQVNDEEVLRRLV